MLEMNLNLTMKHVLRTELWFLWDGGCEGSDGHSEDLEEVKLRGKTDELKYKNPLSNKNNNVIYKPLLSSRSPKYISDVFKDV